MTAPSFSDWLERRTRHRLHMDLAHDFWEGIHGTPCGPPYPRGNPQGIITTWHD